MSGPELPGKAAEVAVLADMRRGRGRLALVEGDAGMGLDLLPSPEEGLAWSALHGHCNESNRDHCRASDIEIWVKALGHIATAAAAVGSRQPERPFGVVDISALIWSRAHLTSLTCAGFSQNVLTESDCGLAAASSADHLGSVGTHLLFSFRRVVWVALASFGGRAAMLAGELPERRREDHVQGRCTHGDCLT